MGPVAPVGPWGPVGPVFPVGPFGPVGPVAPVGPWGPVGPVFPVGPFGPVGPVAPVGPWGPVGPAGIPKVRVPLDNATVGALPDAKLLAAKLELEVNCPFVVVIINLLALVPIAPEICDEQ